jgi:hypothetical protein
VTAEPDEQTIRFRFSVDVVRPNNQTAKEISDEILDDLIEIDGAVSVRELGWKRLVDGEQ